MSGRLGCLAVLTAVVTGCGGSTTPPPPPDLAPSEADVAVIRGWGRDMQRGHVKRASARFAVPAVVANNTPEFRLKTRAEVEFFNRTLPCGGRLVMAERHHGLILATFELTERPGATCGSGTGRRAQAAFGLRDGKIVRWIRVPNRPPPDPSSGGLV